MYDYDSSATLTTVRLHYKLQTHPLVREDTPRRRAKQLSSKRKEKEKIGHGLIGQLTVSHNINSTQLLHIHLLLWTLVYHTVV
jgi:hypothetical protein